MASNKITLEQYIGFRKKLAVKEKKKINIAKILSFVFLSVFCILWIAPIVIMFFASLRSYTDGPAVASDLFYPRSGYSLEGYQMIIFKIKPVGLEQISDFSVINVPQWLLNSCISAIGGTLLYLFVASIAAYAFTFIDFKYRNLIFALLVGSMVIPGAATTVGNLSMVYGMGLNKTALWALIIPGLGGVYGMYLIKTFFESIPSDLIESARMDGYSNFKIFYKIVLPLGKTVLFVQGLFGFMGGWNDLIWPRMLYGDSTKSHLWTLQVGIYEAMGKIGDVYTAAVLASGALCLIPVIIVYIIAQDKIIEGMASSGIKR